MQRSRFIVILVLLLLVVLPFTVYAHSGGTDSQGGHRSPDGYHYHHGKPAHQHINDVCPYDIAEAVLLALIGVTIVVALVRLVKPGKNERKEEKMEQQNSDTKVDFEAQEWAKMAEDILKKREASSKGATMEQPHGMKRGEEENRQHRQTKKEEIRARVHAESEVCRKKYPSFSLEDELNDPETGQKFFELLKNGVDVTSAYEVVHLEELKHKKKKKARSGQSLKDLLSSSLGVFGFVLYYLITTVILYAPIYMLDMSFFWALLLLIIINVVPIIGPILNIILWIVSFIDVAFSPIDGWSIYYFIALAINIVMYVIPFIKRCIAYIVEKKRG